MDSRQEKNVGPWREFRLEHGACFGKYDEGVNKYYVKIIPNKGNQYYCSLYSEKND